MREARSSPHLFRDDLERSYIGGMVRHRRVVTALGAACGILAVASAGGCAIGDSDSVPIAPFRREMADRFIISDPFWDDFSPFFGFPSKKSLKLPVVCRMLGEKKGI